VLFDYLVYTTGKPEHHVPIGEIVGPAVGGAAAITILAAILVFCRKRRTQRGRATKPSTEGFQPYMIQGGDFERRPKAAGFRQAAVVLDVHDGLDQTSDAGSRPESNGRRVGNTNAQRDVLQPLAPHQLEQTLSFTGQADQLPQYESLPATSP